MISMVVYSLYFGVTPYDEAFYISMPYRFILGDRPFVDEYNISQTAGFFTLPFIKGYLYLKGSTEGIFLFARYLHFFCCILLFGLVFLTFKKIVDPQMAILLALPCIVFSYGN